MNNKNIIIVFILCAILTLPTKSFAESFLIFNKSTVNLGFMPHTIVLPDCESIPYMAVLSSCLHIDASLLVYSPLFPHSSPLSSFQALTFTALKAPSSPS